MPLEIRSFYSTTSQFLQILPIFLCVLSFLPIWISWCKQRPGVWGAILILNTNAPYESIKWTLTEYLLYAKHCAELSCTIHCTLTASLYRRFSRCHLYFVGEDIAAELRLRPRARQLQSSGPCAVVASPGPASHCWQGPQKQSFHSLSFQGDADETLQGQNFCLCQLAYGKTVVTFYVISLEVAEPISDIKWGQWSFCSLASSGQCSHLSVLQLESYCPLDL